MICSLARRFGWAAVLLGLCAAPALAEGAGLAATLYDERGRALGTTANPLAVTGGTGGGGGGASGVVTTNPGSCAITQTIVTGTSGTLIAANASRKSLRWMNVGAVVVTVAPGTTAPTAGQGMLYEPNGNGAGHQGGSEVFNDTAVATSAFTFAATATATITVWECQ